MKAEDAIFWERIAEMPWVEAEQECVSRREQLAGRIQELTIERMSAVLKHREEVGTEIADCAAQLTRLNGRIKYLRKAQDNVNWRKAVTALWGQEGYEMCREWLVREEVEYE